jgi:hypothetical protein
VVTAALGISFGAVESTRQINSGNPISSLFANPAVPDFLGARRDDEATST